MRGITLTSVIVVALLAAPFAWGLSESDQAGIDKLLTDTRAALTGAEEPGLWSLFSTQGSAAVWRTDEGFVAAGRSKLKSDETVAATFSLPENVEMAGQALGRVGDFIVGRVQFTASIAPPPVPPTPVPASLGDLWGAFWVEGPARFVEPQPEEGTVPVEPEPLIEEWEMTISAVRDGPKRTWRYVSLCVTPYEEETDQAAAADVAQTLRSWERTMLQGDVTELSQHLYDDPFIVAAYTPDGQAWYFAYPEYLTTMLASALAMGSAEQSNMLDLDVRVSGPVATALGKWFVEIPMFGSATLGLSTILVQEDGKWMLVALSGGMLEE